MQAAPIPCTATVNGHQIRSVYIVGSDTSAVVWAYKNLTDHGCLNPVTDASKADVILNLRMPPSHFLHAWYQASASLYSKDGNLLAALKSDDLWDSQLRQFTMQPKRSGRGGNYRLNCLKHNVEMQPRVSIGVSRDQVSSAYVAPVPINATTPEGIGSPPLTNASIIEMVKAKLGDSIVISTIRANPARYDLAVGSLVTLKKAGVSDNVLAAMIAKNAPSNAPSASSSQPLIHSDRISRIFIKGNTEVASNLRRDFMKTNEKYGDHSCLLIVGSTDKADAILEVGQHETSGGFLGTDNVTTVASGTLSARDGTLLWSDSKQGAAGVFHTGAGSAAEALENSLYKSLAKAHRLNAPCEI